MNGPRLQSALELSPRVPRDDDEASAERLLGMAEPPVAEQELRLSSGHVVRADAAERSRLTVHAPDGSVQLSVSFTANGPVLRFESAELELSAPKQIRIDCDRFDVRTRERVLLQSDGDIEHAAGRDALIHAQRNLTATAPDLNLVAHDGRVCIDARQDVDVHGAKILLNC
jgi:uncharacterized protein (DUF2345 family)